MSSAWPTLILDYIKFSTPLPLSWEPNKRATVLRVHCRQVEPLRLSRHSWEIAIDLDVLDNPDGPARQMHAGVLAAFESAGFERGGRGTRCTSSSRRSTSCGTSSLFGRRRRCPSLAATVL